MEKFDLPMIAGTVRLEVAVQVMADAKRSGVIVEGPRRLKVLDLDIVLHTLRNRGNWKTGRVRSRMETVNLEIDLARLEAERTATIEPDVVQEIHFQLDGAHAAYGVPRVKPGMAVVRASHESKTATLLGDRKIEYTMVVVFSRYEHYSRVVSVVSSTWRCRRNHSHIWRQEELVGGRFCPLDSSLTDRV